MEAGVTKVSVDDGEAEDGDGLHGDVDNFEAKESKVLRETVPDGWKTVEEEDPSIPIKIAENFNTREEEQEIGKILTGYNQDFGYERICILQVVNPVLIFCE